VFRAFKNHKGEGSKHSLHSRKKELTLAKDRTKLTDEQIQKFIRRAKIVAKKHGYPELADDFSQEIFVYWLSGRRQAQTLDQAFIEYLRTLYGHTRTKCNRSRLQAQRHYIELSEIRNLAHDSRVFEASWRPPDSPGGEAVKLDRAFLSQEFGCDREDRILLILYFEWGFLLEEIGDLFEFTQSRASQVLAQALSDYKKREAQEMAR
jgi:hypothetical protein